MTERVLHAVPDIGAEDEPLMRDLIGTVLRRARLEQGRTLREVAETAQVSLPYLSEIERGRKEPSSEVLAAVYRALGLQLVDLVGDLHTELAPPVAAPRRPAPGAPGPQAMLLAV
ncbi:transcriptional regulator with XRE-family HTH domain [Spinactinospora alkalitolerans]|uniref:Transcriptional regulator with XRE-family HTH domain n=1 Tax=Spinactinospora alkalitolerans TaxID=687207 RepID=A0A852TR63_9ACTN|nr:helix-turn-helix transcriptional regulator [Spinactinospora alkalitolerans]NYE45163.1 transcriptional regulator with XRE-family HTH domain [Spinactinospora alkalitolerans]